MSAYLLVLFLIAGSWTAPVHAQINGSFDVSGYTIRLGTDSLTRVMRFTKSEDQNAYTNLQYYLPGPGDWRGTGSSGSDTFVYASVFPGCPRVQKRE
jgi:hypothetical protein